MEVVGKMFLLTSSTLKKGRNCCVEVFQEQIPEVREQGAVTSYPPPAKGLKPPPQTLVQGGQLPGE